MIAAVVDVVASKNTDFTSDDPTNTHVACLVVFPVLFFLFQDSCVSRNDQAFVSHQGFEGR